jgi:hypothetical protein
MKIPNEYFGLIKKCLEWRCQNRAKSINLEHFGGVFEIFKGGKGTTFHESRKFYLVTFSSTHQSKQFFPKYFFTILLHLGDIQIWLKILSPRKVQSWHFHIAIESDWSIRLKI